MARKRSPRKGGTATSNPVKARQRLQSALAHQQAGRREAAARIYRELLQGFPDQPQVLHYYGLLQHQMGASEKALELMRRARPALARDPAYWNNLGLVHAALGDAGQAMTAAERALALDPAFAGAWFNLGVFAEQAGRSRQAAEAYRQALHYAPDHLKARHNLGLLLLDLGRYLEAEGLYREGLEQRQDFPGYYEGLITALFHLGRAAEVKRWWEHLQALAQSQGAVPLSLARVHRLLGEYAQAEDHYRAVLERDPDAVGALTGLCAIRRATEADRPLLRRMEALLARPLRGIERRQLHFTLGKAHADLGEHDTAFLYYAEGNRLMAQEVTYDGRRHEERVQRIIETFDHSLLNRPQGGASASRRPLFIVGMPRSGTTLVEQILAAHPAVAAGGELPYFAEIQRRLQEEASPPDRFPASLRETSPERLRALAADYLGWLDAIDVEAPHVTDKMPFNYRWIGLIHLLFPDAAIIHCRRDPVDTCLSCYFQDFTARIDFAWRLEDLAHYYGLYRRMMAHWEAVLPGRVLHLDYEALVRDPEPEVRRLLDHCGLEWDEACLSFHEVKRPVLTASTWQVRQPLYTSSVKRWKRYEKHLGPLLEGLRPWLQDDSITG